MVLVVYFSVSLLFSIVSAACSVEGRKNFLCSGFLILYVLHLGTY